MRDDVSLHAVVYALTYACWYNFVNTGTNDGCKFYQSITPLSNADEYCSKKNFFWQ
jgi:hypothetical protein